MCVCVRCWLCSGMMLTSALIMWKALMCITGSESPAVVVLTGSMEPGFKRVIYPILALIMRLFSF